MKTLEAEKKFIDLLNKVPNVAVQGYNKDRVVIFWNKASEHIYGYTENEALGQKLEDLIIPDFMRDEVINHVENWYNNGVKIPAGELPLRDKYGDTVYVYSSHVMLGEGSSDPEMFCIDIDLTQNKEQEEELRKKDELMIVQSRHAAMGEMISMIAHQWRQPLSSILMSANNIMVDIDLDAVDKDVFSKHAKDIHLQTEELSKTIDDFKNFFKPTKVVENVLPEDIINETFKVIGKSLDNNEITVITQFNSDKKIDTYSRELMQVFMNIIKNAKETLVEKDIPDKKIKIEIEHDLNSIIIKVSDNAGGIPDNIIDKIFDPYFSTKDEKSGTGLGLYMSKTIIEKHFQGKLEAYNENGGACFKIELPFQVK